MKRIALSLTFSFLLFSNITFAQSFVKTENGKFRIGNSNYYYIGANFWYGAILASKKGDRDRLIKELSELKAIGVNNLRILVGADGPLRPNKVSPSLQTAPGVYNDDVLDGLDFLLAEMQKRGMKAVLYLTNSWEWSGGYSQYLEWTGHGKAPVPAVDDWNTFTAYVANFVTCDSCKLLVQKHVKYIIGRTNRYTKKKYINDPAIMAWQIANEPRAYSDAGKKPFADWVKGLAHYIKSIDKNHLVSTGSEGQMGSEGDISLWEDIHADPAIDYLTIHIWPFNWGWADKKNLASTMPKAISSSEEYLNKHLSIARKLNKPLVAEEFGFPRDSVKFTTESSTALRDQYYKAMFNLLESSIKKGDNFVGCNFWAWGGTGRATIGHTFWQEADAYLGDPAQEEQGLNSVFDSDSTVKLIKAYNRELAARK